MSSLREQLTDIWVKHGELTGALVRDEARPDDHPLHARFEWDDSVAGELWREKQGNDLIRSVEIRRSSQTSGDEVTVRAFVSVTRPDNRPTYMPTEQALADPVSSEIVLREFEREWQQLRRRYGHLVEFAQIIQRDLYREAS